MGTRLVTSKKYPLSFTVDIDVRVQLEEDFILVDIIHNNQSYSEFHMYPVRKIDVKKVSEKERGDKLNVIMIMSDSISRSDAERYLKKTYAMLKNSSDSVVLEVQLYVSFIRILVNFLKNSLKCF